MRFDLARKFPQMVWGDSEGWAFLARKKAPEGEGGAFITEAFRWPQDAKKIADFIFRNAGDHGMFWVPAIRTTDKLEAGNADEYRWLWVEADIKNPPVLNAQGWNPWVVRSGRPGHHHIYQRLTRPISFEQWTRQATVLKAFYGCDAARPTDTRFVRIPGTMNRKGQLDAPRPVKLIRKGAAIPWKTVSATVDDHDNAHTRPVRSRPQRVYEGRLPGGVAGMVATDDARQAHRLLFKVGRKCAEAGMTAEQVIELVDGSELHHAKLSSDPAYNLVADMTRVVSR